MTAAVRWALKNESIDSAAIAMSDYAQVETNVQALTQPYSPADQNLLSGAGVLSGAHYEARASSRESTSVVQPDLSAVNLSQPHRAR